MLPVSKGLIHFTVTQPSTAVSRFADGWLDIYVFLYMYVRVDITFWELHIRPKNTINWEWVNHQFSIWIYPLSSSTKRYIFLMGWLSLPSGVIGAILGACPLPNVSNVGNNWPGKLSTDVRKFESINPSRLLTHYCVVEDLVMLSISLCI